MKLQRTCLSRLLMIAAITLVFASPSRAVAPESAFEHNLLKTFDYSTFFDANSLLMFVTNSGSFAHDKARVLGKFSGLYYPRGTNSTIVYAAGLWVGAKVGGNVRVAISEYSDEYAPGVFGSNPLDPRFHVYKINSEDVPMANPDYVNWPFADGAPALKAADGSDSLDSYGNRIPLLIGEQTMWSVFNDGDPAYHTNNSGSTDPLGIEVQNTAFGFHRSDALGRVVFMNWKIKNTGPDLLEDVYVSLWADPDIGDAGDDLLGCDTALGVGYGYNSGSDAIYGPEPPAVGFTMLQGPAVPAGDADTAYAFGQAYPGYRNLPMTAFAKYINGTDPKNASQTYNYMRGLSANGFVITDPWGHATAHMLAGDPVAGTGWLDSNPDDRRYMISAGPFTLAVGDSQEVVIAVCVGQGTDRLASITDLRSTALAAKAAYAHGFDIAPEPASPEMVIDIRPGVCPNVLFYIPNNPFRDLAKGLPSPPVADDPNIDAIPVAICGTPSLDVRNIDRASLKLAGVELSGFAYRDMTSPGVPDNVCDCLRGAPDGRMDLVAQVNRVQLYTALGSPPTDELVPVLCTGRLTDGRWLEGSDCMSIRRPPVTDIDFGIFETNGPGGFPLSPPNNVAYSLNSTFDWYVSSDQRGDFTRMDWREQSIHGETWEIRFSESASEYYDFNADSKFGGRAPFEIWNLGVSTPDDPSDDRRVQFEVVDDDESGGWSMGDRVYVVEAQYSEPLPQVFDFDAHWPQDFHIGRIIFNDNSGNGRPADGTVVRFTARSITVKSRALPQTMDIKRMAMPETAGAGARLESNYPNPFNAATTIVYRLQQESHVLLEVFNVLGQRTQVLVDRVLPEGRYEVTWPGTDDRGNGVASGMYFYRLQTADGVQSRKMILLK